MAVDYKKEGRIAIFTINRPEAMNALSTEVHRELYDGMMDFRDNPDLWVAIITGAGDRAFSAGADLKGMGGSAGRERATEPVFATKVADTIWKPFIAAVNGYAVGGGLELALSCDIRIAAEHARFGLPEVTRGLTPGWGGLQYLTRFISRSHAAELILTGKLIDAQEAYRMGLLNEVMPLDQLMPKAMQWAETICQAAPLAVRASKECMIRGYDVTLREGFQLDADIGIHGPADSEDSMEGTRAFAEKRKPVWKGK
ncbi:enoyl-CoA hydratase-related protein [Chloroflexota bacterium]